MKSTSINTNPEELHLSTLTQSKYKVNEEDIDQENGKENGDDIGPFVNDQADEDDIFISKNDFS